MDTRAEIELRARLANRIKAVKYSDKVWPEIYQTIAKEISLVVKHGIMIYPEKSQEERIHELIKYSDEDLQDVLDLGKEAKCVTDPGSPSDT